MNTAGSEATSRPRLHFHGYLLENVYLCTTAAERSEIVALWQEEEAGLKGEAAERSSREMVFMVRAPSGELVGASTVALVRLKNGERFYSFSLFLRKRDRVPNLMITVCDATRDFLRGFKHPVAQPVGMLNINENPKLMRPGARRVFERHGYRYWGQTSEGEDVWVTEFAENGPRPANTASMMVPTPGNKG